MKIGVREMHADKNEVSIMTCLTAGKITCEIYQIYNWIKWKKSQLTLIKEELRNVK